MHALPIIIENGELPRLWMIGEPGDVSDPLRREVCVFHQNTDARVKDVQHTARAQEKRPRVKWSCHRRRIQGRQGEPLEVIATDQGIARDFRSNRQRLPFLRHCTRLAVNQTIFQITGDRAIEVTDGVIKSRVPFRLETEVLSCCTRSEIDDIPITISGSDETAPTNGTEVRENR